MKLPRDKEIAIFDISVKRSNFSRTVLIDISRVDHRSLRGESLNLSLSDQEVDDLIVMLQYYKMKGGKP